MKVPRKIKKKIPRGRYCYNPLTRKSCSYFFFNDLDYGDCRLLLKYTGTINGHNNNVDYALNDQCKACDIKID